MMELVYGENPAFVVSLDFELHWGILDHTPLGECESLLLNAREAVQRMLSEFEAREIRATWATVGALFCDGKEELGTYLQEDPKYSDRRLGVNRHLAILGESEKDDPFHFAPSLIREILEAPGQEVATHTFAHIYGYEEGVSANDFRNDLTAALGVAQGWGHRIRSIVFPRNQFNTQMLQTIQDLGIETFRGTPLNRGWGGNPEIDLGQRAMRLVDAFRPLANPVPVVRGEGPIDVPATLFFRTDVPRSARQLILNRVKSGLKHAALHGGTFHLWWHPHNFGHDLLSSMSMLAEVLDYFEILRDEYGMQSHCMQDFRRWESMSEP